MTLKRNEGESAGPGAAAAGPLAARLPEFAARRVQVEKLDAGVASLVLDVEGLATDQRTALEVQVRSALEGVAGIEHVRVALLGARAATQTGAAQTGAAQTGAAQAGAQGSDTPGARTRTARPRIIAVASGKGGVGKSTVSANLAVALARRGLRVGLVDADIQGPSQARLMGTENERPVAHDKRLVPLASQWGVPMLSMAHLAGAGEAIAWRGSMVAGAMVKMLEAHWDHAEVLVVDLPPGTGDVQLTLIKQFPPEGVVIVSTPQDLALIDARRATALFEKANVPVVGLVENMAGYACPHCGEVSDPFGSGGAQAAARDQGLAFLGRIPLDIAIRRQSDEGVPVAAGEGEQAQAFAALAGQIAAWLEKNATAAPEFAANEAPQDGGQTR